MTEKLFVSPSPHLRCGDTTQKIMGDVLIALIPAAIASLVIFGFRACQNILLLFSKRCKERLVAPLLGLPIPGSRRKRLSRATG